MTEPTREPPADDTVDDAVDDERSDEDRAIWREQVAENSNDETRR